VCTPYLHLPHAVQVYSLVVKIAGRHVGEKTLSPARHQNSLEINSTLSGWSSRIARTNSPASNTFLSPFAFGDFRFNRLLVLSAKSSVVRLLRCFVPRPRSPPRARKLVTLTRRRYSFFFFFLLPTKQGGIRHDRPRARDGLVFFQCTRWKAPENGILRKTSNPRAIHRGPGLLLI